LTPSKRIDSKSSGFNSNNKFLVKSDNSDEKFRSIFEEQKTCQRISNPINQDEIICLNPYNRRYWKGNKLIPNQVDWIQTTSFSWKSTIRTTFERNSERRNSTERRRATKDLTPNNKRCWNQEERNEYEQATTRIWNQEEHNEKETALREFWNQEEG